MKFRKEPVIVNWSAISSLGATAAQTAFFLRAGSSSVRVAPFMDEWGERIHMCYADWLPSGSFGTERIVLLAEQALAPLLGVTGDPVRIALALPERYAAKPLDNDLNVTGRTLADRLQNRLGRRFSNFEIEFFPSGRAGGALALERALGWLTATDPGFVIAGGVDSFYDWKTLEILEKQDRLLTQENLDGFIPGEGAAFLTLSNDVNAQPCARVAGLGIGYELAPILSEQASRASGITNAMNKAVQTLRNAVLRSNYWFVDLTHEVYGIKEFQRVITRFGDLMGTNLRLETPLREIGNTGAATVPLFAVLACEAWSHGYAQDRFCVALGASDNGLRGAVLLEEVRAWQ
jgi:3-oxoacyl-[acyl-carrier-protein] synthase-1